MKKKYVVGVLMDSDEIDMVIDDLDEIVHFTLEDKVIQLPRELIIMLHTMDYTELGVA